jgi:hypothetical protein
MRPLSITVLAVVLALGALGLPRVDAGAGIAPGGYTTAFARWRAADDGFATWALGAGVVKGDGNKLVLDPAAAPAGADSAGTYEGGHNFYNGGAYQVAEATGPLHPAGFGFRRAVASWTADTPPGSWIEVLARVQVGGRLTKFYNLGVWAADGLTVSRHSVKGQQDQDGRVAVDTLIVNPEGPPADAVQLQVRLFTTRPDAIPVLRLATVAVSTTPQRPAAISPGDPARWNRILDVPACSQRYVDGDGWCSPTSTSMVLGFWNPDGGPCEPRVRAAVDGVYDWVFDGHGNWPFNTAYAATQGDLDAYVARFTGLDQAEEWITAGVPLVMSYSWDAGQLDNAPVSSSDGHLSVLVGFDDRGNPVVHDTAAKTDAEVRRVYDRAQFEALWQQHSGGTVYLIHPPGWVVPGL